jgi:F0F1-type ATP synthase membrane subunit b/b'
MVLAIAACRRVDEAKEIRDKARAIEVYAAQALNRDAERQAAEIRVRAERRTGKLLKEMKQSGERSAGHKPKKD